MFVSKLPPAFTSEELRALFDVCGTIEEARVVVDKKSGESKGHGLVQFKNVTSMTAAFAMNKKQVVYVSRKCSVEFDTYYSRLVELRYLF